MRKEVGSRRASHFTPRKMKPIMAQRKGGLVSVGCYICGWPSNSNEESGRIHGYPHRSGVKITTGHRSLGEGPKN